MTPRPSLNSLHQIARAALLLGISFAAAHPAWSSAFGGADEAPAAVKPTLLGSLTFNFSNQTALASYPNESKDVSDAMTEALNIYNTVARYSGSAPVSFVTTSGVTAHASAFGYIEYGTARSARVAQHEMAHWMGLTQWGWGVKASFQGLCNNGWQGAVGKARVHAFVPGAGLGCGGHHFWPYGLNYDRELDWLSVGRNVAMVGAMRADLGHSDGSKLPDQDFRLVNRATGQMLADKSQVEAGDVIDAQSTVSTKQVWSISFDGGFIRLKNVHSNRFLDGSGASPVLRASPTWADGVWWEMTPTTNGHFRLRNKASNLCLRSAGNLSAGASMQLADCQGYANPDAALQFQLATKAPQAAPTPPSANASGSIVSTQSGLCMGAPISTANAGQQHIGVWQCNGNAAQKWNVTAAQELVIQQDGKCLDARAARTTAGTRLISWRCHGRVNQKWAVQPNGSITNPSSGLCVDGGRQTNGASLILQVCNGGAGQKWQFQ